MLVYKNMKNEYSLFLLILFAIAHNSNIFSSDKLTHNTGQYNTAGLQRIVLLKDSISDTKFDYSIKIKNDSDKVLTLEKWKGKYLLIIYAHNDCPYCKKLINLFSKKIKSTSYVETIIIFSGNDPANNTKDFINETLTKSPYFYDYDFQLKAKYGSGIVPTTLFVKNDGTYKRIKGIKKEEIENLIEVINNIIR